MSRARRYGSPWLLFWTFLLSAGLQGGAVGAYQALRPIPPPQLSIQFAGDGAGLVMTVPAGLSCTKDCSAPFTKGTTVKLITMLEDDATFEGWGGACENRTVEDILEHGGSALECELTIEEDTHVLVALGKAPDQVEVAWARLPDQPETDKQFTVTLPDPEIEAELLIEDIPLPIEPEQQPEIQPIKPPEVAPPPPQTAPAPNVQQPPQQLNLRSVEVPDENEVEEAPDDATHLSDKNRDVAEETRAEETNLDRAQQGEAVASEQSDVQSEEIGAEEERIAQLEDTEPNTLDDVRPEEIVKSGEDSRAIGAIAGEAGENGQEGDAGDGTQTQEPGLLAMRDIQGRGPLVDDHQDHGQGGEQGPRGSEGRPGIKTQLEFKDYERIVGKEKADAEMKLGRRKVSARRGRWEKKLGAVKSALENFTPDVKPGNQTALKTRAAPFAIYIARMHRRIHELWGFGFLADLDGKSASHPLNNWDLYTEIEIVIDPDGSVYKTTIVKHSGRLEFDVAAIDTILTASPYEPTPKKIRSPDERVYMRWGFNRNWRQCGTFNARPFILSEAPAGDKANDDSDLVRGLPGRKRQAREQAEAASAKAAARLDDGVRAAAGLLSPDDPAAKFAANMWITGFSKRDIGKMVKVSAAPFRSGNAVIANSPGEIGGVYRTILQETSGRFSDWKLMSSAGYRKRFGALPAGIEPGTKQLLMVVRARDQQFTLVLEKSGGDYKITALHR